MTPPIDSQDKRKPNLLAGEKSPYLLQHQFNPVDWRPWNDEALEAARVLNRPILLSIGYSTCHWCHVMERESFENEATAALLNQHFIPIKVDREERPDIDRIYMTYVQTSFGQGGWPLNVFLTPDLLPFHGGTYFPPTQSHGRPGFPELLQRVIELWQTREADLRASSREVLARLLSFAEREPDPSLVLSPRILQTGADSFSLEYDPLNGGYGGAPKFPRPAVPRFALAHAVRTGDSATRDAVLHTCDRMAAGGIHDHLDGGFARYSVDDHWLVPHFEKMLYDNAQLVQLYLDAWRISENPAYARVARSTIDYVLRDMTHPEGGFFSAEDADSEGQEGKFHCWTDPELRQILDPDAWRAATSYFGITPNGNFIDHSHPNPLRGLNVLSICNPSIADTHPADLARAIETMRARRATRIRPQRDDKILASWNGLMIGAMARAGIALNEPRYLDAATRGLNFLQSKLWDASSQTLSNRWCNGGREDSQVLDAYAFLLLGVIDLYESSLDPSTLSFAIDLAESLIARFYDPLNGGFWQSPVGTPHLVLNLKEDYDGAEPSGNSVTILALHRLGSITGKPGFTQAAEKSLRLFADRLQRQPQAVPALLQALAQHLLEPSRIIITGNRAHPSFQALLNAAHRGARAETVISGDQGPVDLFAQSLPHADSPIAYACLRTRCQAPESDPDRLLAQLRGQM